MNENELEMLDMLESLLSMTERYKSGMNSEDYKEWQRISAKTADLRDGEDV